MQIGEMKARPPHVSFKLIAIEDRTASIEAGHPVYKDVPHVTLTPMGSRDSVTKPVSEWLEQSEAQVQQDRLPAEWLEKFRAAFKHWQAGEEVPVNGSALANWPAISPAELQSCKSVNILTIEDLAAANEEAVRRIGMGGVALRQRAKIYLDASTGPGKILAENEDLRVKLQTSEERRLVLETRVKELEALVPNAKSPVTHTPAAVGKLDSE